MIKPIIALVMILSTGTSSPLEISDSERKFMSDLLILTVSEMQNSLKDSQSARFKKVHYRMTIGTNGNRNFSICGFVNARNSFGGYSGWQQFHSAFYNKINLTIDPSESISARKICDPQRGVWDTENDLSEALRTGVTGS